MHAWDIKVWKHVSPASHAQYVPLAYEWRLFISAITSGALSDVPSNLRQNVVTWPLSKRGSRRPLGRGRRYIRPERWRGGNRFFFFLGNFFAYLQRRSGIWHLVRVLYFNFRTQKCCLYFALVLVSLTHQIRTVFIKWLYGVISAQDANYFP